MQIIYKILAAAFHLLSFTFSFFLPKKKKAREKRKDTSCSSKMTQDCLPLCLWYANAMEAWERNSRNVGGGPTAS